MFYLCCEIMLYLCCMLDPKVIQSFVYDALTQWVNDNDLERLPRKAFGEVAKNAADKIVEWYNDPAFAPKAMKTDIRGKFADKLKPEEITFKDLQAAFEFNYMRPFPHQTDFGKWLEYHNQLKNKASNENKKNEPNPEAEIRDLALQYVELKQQQSENNRTDIFLNEDVLVNWLTEFYQFLQDDDEENIKQPFSEKCNSCGSQKIETVERCANCGAEW